MDAAHRRKTITHILEEAKAPVSAASLAKEFSVSRQIIVGDVALLRAGELEIMVDQGCQVLDVVVEHPVYGQLTGQLRLASRYDVQEFIRLVSQSNARPLSDLTGGIHLHTLRCPDEDSYRRVLADLEREGILYRSEEQTQG